MAMLNNQRVNIRIQSCKWNPASPKGWFFNPINNVIDHQLVQIQPFLTSLGLASQDGQLAAATEPIGSHAGDFQLFPFPKGFMEVNGSKVTEQQRGSMKSFFFKHIFSGIYMI